MHTILDAGRTAVWRTASLVLLAAAPLSAQAVASQPSALDPGRQLAQGGIMLMRDSVSVALGAIAQLQRDYRQASAPTLESYARQVNVACAAAERTWPTARRMVADAGLTTVQQQRAQGDMLQSFDRLKPGLAECQRTFGPLGQPGKGEEVRGYGNRRAEPVRGKLEAYNRSILPFIRALKLDAREVIGAGPSPLER